MRVTKLVQLTLLFTIPLQSLAASVPPTLELWPGRAPGDTGDLGQETDTTKPTDGLVAGRRVIRLGNVSKPSLTIYRPQNQPAPGPAVLVCPGGGYHILAMDLEGTEVCEWLNGIGVTGVLLKYRVPRRSGLEKHDAALQDAQRALGLLRQRGAEFGIASNRLGILGFSAGAHLAAAASNNYRERTYTAIDAADSFSCRPDFTLLIYPAYLTVKEQNDRVAPELALSTNTPPTFMVIAQDDPVRMENALYYALGLRNVSVPVELHLYPSGGHGYGLRPSNQTVTTWPARATDWLRGLGVAP
jgi:acetyl esterase/lipase